MTERSEAEAPDLILGIHSLFDLEERTRAALVRLIAQLGEVSDPDVLGQFVAYRDDPELETIMQLATNLDSEARFQLIGVIEDALSEAG